MNGPTAAYTSEQRSDVPRRTEPADVERRVEAEANRIRSVYPLRGGHERYSWFDAAHLYAMQEVEGEILAALQRHRFAPIDEQRVLEVGCGAGVWLRQFVKWGAAPDRLAGIDLLEQRIEQGRRLCPREIRLESGNAAALPFEDGAFDVVLQSLVFTSVTDAVVRAQMAAEMIRVTRPGGLILWYDYHVDNPRNPDVKRVSASELRRLFRGCTVDLRRVTLAPPLARLVAPRSRGLYRLLAAVPLLRTHYFAAIRRPA
jgi:ubiquinone/menaquinone biosynthesis C-methylase UbiE